MVENIVSHGSFNTEYNEFITGEMLFAFPTSLTFELNIVECPSFLQVFLFAIDFTGASTLAEIRIDGPQSVVKTLDLMEGGKYRARVESGGGRVSGAYVVKSTIPLAIRP